MYIMINVLHDFSDLSQERLDAIKADHVARTKALEIHILGLTNLTWQTLVQPYIDYKNSYTFWSILQMKDLHPDKTVRNNAANLYGTMINLLNVIDNKHVNAVFQQYATTQFLIEKSTLTNEQVKFFTEQFNFTYVPNSGTMDGIQKLKIEINALTCQINEHYKKDYPKREFDYEELNYGAETIDYVDKRYVRKIITHEYQNHLSKILPAMERVAFARQELAKLNGWAQHSDAQLAWTMIKTTQAVNTFLDKAHILLKPYIDRDMATLREMAKADGIDELQDYDIQYYCRKHEMKVTNYGGDYFRKYFPYKRTVRNILHLFEVFLGYTFTEIQTENNVWDTSVKLLEVKENNVTKGYVYLDIVHRHYKQKGGCWALNAVKKSALTLPVSIVCCTFDVYSLTFDEVTSLFHEFGHAMHHISAISTITYMSTDFCEEDFKEVPSQFFEYWCRSPTIIKHISPDIPDDFVQTILTQDTLMAGYKKGKDLVLCKMDMAFHSKNFKGYSYAVAYTICDDILGGGLSENNLYTESQNLFFGYDVGQYRYMYSLSIALELLSVFEGRELDPALGKRFKDEVLSQGALRPSHDSVVAFLGREPDITSFLKVVQ